MTKGLLKKKETRRIAGSILRYAILIFLALLWWFRFSGWFPQRLKQRPRPIRRIRSGIQAQFPLIPLKILGAV